MTRHIGIYWNLLMEIFFSISSVKWWQSISGMNLYHVPNTLFFDQVVKSTVMICFVKISLKKEKWYCNNLSIPKHLICEIVSYVCFESEQMIKFDKKHLQYCVTSTNSIILPNNRYRLLYANRFGCARDKRGKPSFWREWWAISLIQRTLAGVNRGENRQFYL